MLKQTLVCSMYCVVCLSMEFGCDFTLAVESKVELLL